MDTEVRGPVSGLADRCPNCGATAGAAYCQACGQRQDGLNISLRQWLADVFDDQLGINAKLPRTLRMLLFSPGKLTTEWLAGRRAQHVSPVRLYFAVALLFFSILLFSLDRASRTAAPAPEAAAPTSISAWIERTENDTLFARQVGEQAARTMPTAMLLLLPLYALALSLLYRRAGVFYIGHLMFALHVHTFFFLVMLPLVPFVEASDRWALQGSLVGISAALLMYLYLFRAMRVVYRASRFGTAVRLIALFAFDSFVRSVVAFAIVFVKTRNAAAGLLLAGCLALSGCASAIMRGGPGFDMGTLTVSGLKTGVGAHVDAVGYDADEGGGYGVGVALGMAGYTSSGDADPVSIGTIEARYRLPIAPKRSGTRLYWEFGSGIGGAWAPELQRFAIPIQIELGVQRPLGGALIVAGIRERFVGLIGSGSPGADAFNSLQLLIGIGVR
ncbi:MAG: DUF3667 domain-containing protein [Gemmatimonadota bacterium]